ncbi:hypothetical protein MCOR29_011046 [Pyricularia oryzae]|nr:hypothetical protein MCOR29_011046 [Pyricularia oryzae]KAI6483288.1 hypothetical protein MCOR11_010633 [Pyricularia oryzae]KAI6525064.1 hypothetical protein MCOR16_006666 [Pyricularia oryzae]
MKKIRDHNAPATATLATIERAGCVHHDRELQTAELYDDGIQVDGTPGWWCSGREAVKARHFSQVGCKRAELSCWELASQLALNRGQLGVVATVHDDVETVSGQLGG